MASTTRLLDRVTLTEGDRLSAAACSSHSAGAGQPVAHGAKLASRATLHALCRLDDRGQLLQRRGRHGGPGREALRRGVFGSGENS